MCAKGVRSVDFIDMTGKTFHRMKVLEYAGNSKDSKALWLCRCECGTEKVATGKGLRNGSTKSCGCYRLEKNIKHNMSRTNFYTVWRHMKDRCLKEGHAQYKDYGGRGITVCEEWLDFNNFKEDMYEDYLRHIEEFGKNNTSLDRINNNDSYYRNNCRWATHKIQNNNQRYSVTQKWFKAISPRGEEFLHRSTTEFAKEHNLKRTSISSVLNGYTKSNKQWTFRYLTDSEIEELNLEV